MQPTQRDLDKFKEIEDKKRDINHPVTGDFVELKDGTIKRIAHIWDDGDIQFMDGNGSFFLCNGGSCSMSGSLKSGVQLELEKVGTKEGSCWFFSNGIQGMGRGTTNTIQFNLFRESPAYCFDFSEYNDYLNLKEIQNDLQERFDKLKFHLILGFDLFRLGHFVNPKLHDHYMWVNVIYWTFPNWQIKLDKKISEDFENFEKRFNTEDVFNQTENWKYEFTKETFRYVRDFFEENEFAKNEKYIICNKGTIKC